MKRALVDKPGANSLAYGPRRGDYVYDVPVQVELQKMLQNNEAMIKVMLACMLIASPISSSTY